MLGYPLGAGVTNFGQNALRDVSLFEKCNLEGAWATAHTYNVKISLQYIFMLYRQGRSYLSKFALWAVNPLWIRQRENMTSDSQEHRSCCTPCLPQTTGSPAGQLRKEDLNQKDIQ